MQFLWATLIIGPVIIVCSLEPFVTVERMHKRASFEKQQRAPSTQDHTLIFQVQMRNLDYLEQTNEADGFMLANRLKDWETE